MGEFECSDEEDEGSEALPEQIRLEEEIKCLEEALQEAQNQLKEQMSDSADEQSDQDDLFSIIFSEEDDDEEMEEVMIATRKQLEEDEAEEMQMFVDMKEANFLRDNYDAHHESSAEETESKVSRDLQSNRNNALGPKLFDNESSGPTNDGHSYQYQGNLNITDVSPATNFKGLQSIREHELEQSSLQNTTTPKLSPSRNDSRLYQNNDYSTATPHTIRGKKAPRQLNPPPLLQTPSAADESRITESNDESSFARPGTLSTPLYDSDDKQVATATNPKYFVTSCDMEQDLPSFRAKRKSLMDQALSTELPSPPPKRHLKSENTTISQHYTEGVDKTNPTSTEGEKVDEARVHSRQSVIKTRTTTVDQLSHSRILCSTPDIRPPLPVVNLAPRDRKLTPTLKNDSHPPPNLKLDNVKQLASSFQNFPSSSTNQICGMSGIVMGTREWKFNENTISLKMDDDNCLHMRTEQFSESKPSPSQTSTENIHFSSLENYSTVPSSSPSNAEKEDNYEAKILCPRSCKKVASFVASVFFKMKSITREIRHHLGPRLATVWECSYRNQYDIPPLHNYVRKTKESIQRIKEVLPDATNFMLNLIASSRRGLLITFFSLTISMFTEMYPTVPKANCFIGFLMIFFQMKPVRCMKSQETFHWKDVEDLPLNPVHFYLG